MNCRHCHRRIVATNWSNGPGWNHDNGDPRCHIHRAEPEPEPWAGHPQNPCSSSTCPVGDDCTDSCMTREVVFLEARPA